MASLEEKREARMAKLRERLERKPRLKKTPGDYLGSWQKPIQGDPPADSLRCNACLQLFRNTTCWEAHRVHIGTPIERCALPGELGASQWERSLAGVWSLGAQAIRFEGDPRRARLNLERLATVRKERERFDFGLDPHLQFPARPAEPISPLEWAPPHTDSGVAETDPESL